jgi:hypothetical protein
VEFCLEEWESGKLVTHQWRSSERWRYEEHMDGLAMFRKADAARCARLQEWLYAQGWYVWRQALRHVLMTSSHHAGVTSTDGDRKRRHRLTAASFANESEEQP